MIPLLLVEREQQIPIKIPENFSKSEIKDKILSIIKNDELFTTNLSYQHIKNTDFNNNNTDIKLVFPFDVYDNSGKLLCSIKSDNDIYGINFVFPFDSIECREAFLNLCDEIQHIRAVIYPDKSKE